MNLLRRILVLVLCLMLPPTGLAASGLTGAYPMQATLTDAPDCAPMADMPDCVTMTQTPSTDQDHSPASCKMTTQCQLGSLYYPTPAPAAYRHTGLSSLVTFHYAEPLIVQRLDDFWRPPRVN